MGYWRNWKRASLARTRYWDRNPDTSQLCSHGLVGYDARLTRERSRVRASVRILPFFFFLSQERKKTLNNKIKNHGKNTLFYPYTMLICHIVCYWFKRLWSWYKPVLYVHHASNESGSFAYKFFQNWLRVLTLASVRSTLTLFRRRCYGFWTFYANKKKIKTTKTCLKTWLVNKKKLDLWWHRSTSQHPEIVQDRGHGPGARASPALDPWTWLKQYS